MIGNHQRKCRHGISVLLLATSLCVFLPVQAADTLDLIERWAGDLPVDRLDLLPEDQRVSNSGYIGDPAIFAAIWQAMRPDAIVPAVDFAHNLVVFVRNVDFYNRTSILNVTLDGGEARILAMQTMSALPITDKVAMAMAVVPRSGIEFIIAGDTRIRVSDHR